MQKRPLQTITLKLSDLEEYEAVRRNRKNKAAAGTERPSSVTETATETGPSASSDSLELPVTQMETDRPPVTGWRTAEVVSSSTTTNTGSTEDDTSVAAVLDDADTIAELSDEGWVDIDEEDITSRGAP